MKFFMLWLMRRRHQRKKVFSERGWEKYSTCPKCDFILHDLGASGFAFGWDVCPLCGTELPHGHGETVLKAEYTLTGIKWRQLGGTYFKEGK